jgi:peptidyl-prolyl cis-trans isomerase C
MIRNEKARNIAFRIILVSSCAVSLCCLSLAAAVAAEENKPQDPGKKIVARVNGNPIYLEQLEPLVNENIKKWKKYGLKQDTPELTSRMQMRALSKVIDQELLNQEARKTPVTDADEKAAKKLQAMKKKYGSEEHFQSYLKRNNLTEAELNKSLKEGLYVDEYLKKKGIADPEIPEEKIKNFYTANPENYAREEMVKVRHILIKADEKASPEDREKAYKKAVQIRKDILAGKDFALMAKEYSECNSAAGGGSLGYIERGYMPGPFEQVAFALDKGSISDVVETKFGYHIITVLDKQPAGIAPYEEVHDFIKKFLQEEESKKRLDAHITALREKAKIEVLLEDPDKK